jgi:hypothetical protein
MHACQHENGGLATEHTPPTLAAQALINAAVLNTARHRAHKRELQQHAATLAATTHTITTTQLLPANQHTH